MFIIYKSNHLDILLLQASRIIQEKPLDNIFKKEIFIHDSKTLFQYLNIFFSQKTGISANLKLYHPDDFIWRLFEKILFKKKIQNIFTCPIMMWKIAQILDNKNFFTTFNKKKNKIKKFKFAFLMANIFKQYIFYRPNWIHNWEKGKNTSQLNNHEQWQIKLWIEIINNVKKNNQSANHFSNLFTSFKLLLQGKKIKKIYFPERCFIISSLALNPTYIKIFKKISSYINVYFLYITPYKKNIFNKSNETKILLKNNIHTQNTIHNSLIKLWGQYEKIYAWYILESKKIDIINCFKTNDNNNLLNYIKHDFLNANLLFSNKKTRFLRPTDNSISINICYNKKNEIEILYEKLLMLCNENSSIKPGDIVVTSTSLDTYIPYIDSIFTAIDKTKQVPFFIVKSFTKKTEIILLACKKILNLPHSRFENQEILEFLDIPEIANKFNISDKEINILYSWVEETHVRWAIDDEHKNYLSFPKHKQNTWLYGIEKLLLSYSMNNTDNIWNNILSCSVINGSRAELLSKLIVFITKLKIWHKKLSQSQHINHWSKLFDNLINDFFLCSEETVQSFEMIKKKWIETINDSITSCYTNNISIDILKIFFLINVLLLIMIGFHLA